MMFLWHHALWLLLALPAIAGTYLLLRRRRKDQALRYAGLAGMRAETGRTPRWRTHLPAALMLVALTALLVSVARPVWVSTTPGEQGTVILLMDVSLSMAASDVEPTRLAAARAAAHAFAAAQPKDVHIGVIAFGGHADVVQLPTADRKAVAAALDRLELQRFTAIGSGLMAAILTLVPSAEIGDDYDIFGTGRQPPPSGIIPLEKTRKGKPVPRKAVAPGSYLSVAVILVSDGLGTMGISPQKAAKMAADLGIRVYTVGVGTLYGGVANIEGWPPIHAEFDDATLIEIADITRGEYFLARKADKVSAIYEKLGRRVVLQRMEREVTVLLIALGMVLSLASTALSLSSSGRPA